jgi:hypothetical protein
MVFIAIGGRTFGQKDRSLSHLLSNNGAAFTLMAVQVEPEHTIGKKAAFV